MSCSHVVDAVTGQCVSICPDGTRPRNGVCPGQDPATPFRKDDSWLSDSDCGCTDSGGIPSWVWWAGAGVGALLLLGKKGRRRKR